jgi:glycosyltransferase involved in cell wall biosynthesis
MKFIKINERDEVLWMKLSIIVPVYNMAADNKLRFCLDSLANQTISDYEIIAVDDASTDASLDILHEYRGTLGSLKLCSLMRI